MDAIRRRHSTVLGRLQTRTWQKKRVNNVETESCVARERRDNQWDKTMGNEVRKTTPNLLDIRLVIVGLPFVNADIDSSASTYCRIPAVQ